MTIKPIGYVPNLVNQFNFIAVGLTHLATPHAPYFLIHHLPIFRDSQRLIIDAALTPVFGIKTKFPYNSINLNSMSLVSYRKKD